jgi:hypothetical protein
MTTETQPMCRVCAQPMGATRLVNCPRCETPHHHDCWEYIGGCAIFGCGENPPPLRRALSPVPQLEPAAPVSSFRWWATVLWLLTSGVLMGMRSSSAPTAVPLPVFRYSPPPFEVHFPKIDMPSIRPVSPLKDPLVVELLKKHSRLAATARSAARPAARPDNP